MGTFSHTLGSKSHYEVFEIDTEIRLMLIISSATNSPVGFHKLRYAALSIVGLQRTMGMAKAVGDQPLITD